MTNGMAASLSLMAALPFLQVQHLPAYVLLRNPKILPRAWHGATTVDSGHAQAI